METGVLGLMNGLIYNFGIISFIVSAKQKQNWDYFLHYEPLQIADISKLKEVCPPTTIKAKSNFPLAPKALQQIS
jgi:hypothetical protein